MSHDPVEVMVRTYAGQNQAEAAALYGRDATALAVDGWVPITQTWVADEWPQSAYIAATLLVLLVIGIGLLILFAFIKPVRTLMVTYQRPILGNATGA
ncbi:MAG: hypothetical protein ACRDGD_06550 [Candidatus Limnocylindria bacterium]